MVIRAAKLPVPRLAKKRPKLATTPIVTPWRMALHWENLSSTTPSLMPRPPNRPLKIAKLTPCKKPEVTGSAGRCEPGVGRFTDPHPLTCSFFTSPFCWLMFWLCALPSALSKSVLLVEENSAFHRAQSHASIGCPCRPSWACFFLFLPIPQFFSATSLSGGEISFLSPGGLAAAPGFTHNWLTRLQRGREPVPLVSFPYPVPKTAQRAAQGRVLVFSPERAYPSP